MRIWWCQEHSFQADERAVNQTVEEWRQCLGAAYSEASGPYIEEEGINKGDYTPCRFVPMRLIPDNEYDRVEMDEDGDVRRIQPNDSHKYGTKVAWSWTDEDEKQPGYWLIPLAALDGETP